MGFLFIFLVVIGITTVAVMAKLSAMNAVPALDISIVIFVIGTIVSALLVAVKLPVFPPALFAPTFVSVAVIAGAGGAMAVFAFNHAIRIGHFGFSNAIYRSSFLVPVVVDVVFFGAALKVTTIIGMMLVLLGIFLMSWSEDSFKKGKQTAFRWFLIMMLAFLLSGMPRLGQLLTSNWNQNYFLYLLVYYATGAAILLVPVLRMKKFNPRALIYGSVAGLASYTALFFTLKSLELLKAPVVFPITLSAPIITCVLLSLAMFRETIKPWGWSGIVSGIGGIVILAIWK
jgi:uncharacterized membrane protein